MVRVSVQARGGDRGPVDLGFGVDEPAWMGPQPGSRTGGGPSDSAERATRREDRGGAPGHNPSFDRTALLVEKAEGAQGVDDAEQGKGRGVEEAMRQDGKPQ